MAYMKKCNNNFTPKEQSDWTGCDGKIISNKLIFLQLENALKEERYEYAHKCKVELKRRRAKKGAIL